MKQKIFFIFILSLLISFSYAFAFDLLINGDEIPYIGPMVNLILNGKKYIPKEGEMPPIIIDNKTLVPVREVFEQLGGVVTWDQKTDTVTIKIDKNTIRFKVGSTTVNVNGKEISIDVPPQIINGKLMVPLRAIVENIDFDINWD